VKNSFLIFSISIFFLCCTKYTVKATENNILMNLTKVNEKNRSKNYYQLAIEEQLRNKKSGVIFSALDFCRLAFIFNNELCELKDFFDQNVELQGQNAKNGVFFLMSKACEYEKERPGGSAYVDKLEGVCNFYKLFVKNTSQSTLDHISDMALAFKGYSENSPFMDPVLSPERIGYNNLLKFVYNICAKGHFLSLLKSDVTFCALKFDDSLGFISGAQVNDCLNDHSVKNFFQTTFNCHVMVKDVLKCYAEDPCCFNPYLKKLQVLSEERGFLF
jgi:hypothetical protein